MRYLRQQLLIMLSALILMAAFLVIAATVTLSILDDGERDAQYDDDCEAPLERHGHLNAK